MAPATDDDARAQRRATAQRNAEQVQQQLAANTKVSQDRALESNVRMENMRPTPTQEENDRARLGLLDPNAKKEPDGGEPERVAQQRVLEARMGPVQVEQQPDQQPVAHEEGRRRR